MDLFEILFVALFILFPIMEQVLKRKRTPGPPGDEEAPDRPDEVGRSDGSEGRGRDSALPPGREPGKASDMVPADLWAVLTGERRLHGRIRPDLWRRAGGGGEAAPGARAGVAGKGRVGARRGRVVARARPIAA